MSPEHAEARYFVAVGPLYDARGRSFEHDRHFVVRESRIGRRRSGAQIVAACNDARAANAAIRLLSGKCAVQL